MRARAVVVAGAGLAAAAAVWLAIARGGGGAAAGGSAAERIPAVVSAPASGGGPAPAPERSAAGPLPASLAGTAPDGGLAVDAAGRFVPTRDALDLFDYYLSASGEESDERIRARIEAAIRERLADPGPALALLDRHLAHREAARALFFEEHGAELPLERRLQRIRELRREHFGAELAARLFGAEEDRWRVEVERVRVQRDPALAPEERAARLATLDAELPAEVREGRDAATAALTLREDESRLRAAGAPEAEVQALREARFGPEAAARLAVLDARRAAWDARLAAWRVERDRLAAGFDDPAEREAAIAELLASRFAGAERLRVEALDRLEATGD